MNLLQQALNSILKDIDIQKLKKDSSNLTALYRKGKSLSNEKELIAYLTVRLPATYAVLCQILYHLPPVDSILDLGAGPGTVWWAAQQVWEKTPFVTAIEREQSFIHLGQKLGGKMQWIHSDFTTKTFEPHDLAVFSYSLTELLEHQITSVLTRSWEAAKQAVVIIEPGTPRGYQRMLLARDHLISMGGQVLAPCPHSNRCPMQPPDWCHFAARVERSFLHRKAKLATLPYEDEKYSYAIVSKEPQIHMHSRVLRHPSRRSGHVLLHLCTPTGLKEQTISRKQKELYKKARKCKWGDPFLTRT